MVHPPKQQRQQGSGVGGGGGGERGEMRRIHVVYFLSRNGKTDQPHLMRIHHRQSGGGGVRLSDVKRWLSELRGKDMPESYAWSYKRQYKTGYVWQDLKGDDLITPIDDNEYVLKGTHISTMPGNVRSECGTRLPSKNQKKHSVGDDDHGHDHLPPRRSPPRATSTTSYVDASTQTSPRIADRHRATAVFKLDLSQQTRTSDPGAKAKTKGEKKTAGKAGVSSSLGKCKSGGGGKGITAYVFRNLITCGDTDTSKSTGVMLPVDGRPSSSHHNRGRFGEETEREFRTDGTACRLGERSCSQRGKALKPEKLRSHVEKTYTAAATKRIDGKGRRWRSETTASRAAEDDDPSKDMMMTYSFLLVH